MDLPPTGSGDAVRRVEVSEGDTVGVVFAPEGESKGSVVVFSGSGGGIPEGYARRLAEYRLTACALGYFGVPGLPSTLVEIPLEMVQRGIETFSEQFTSG